jgi:[protein-PII] uridylyltransferase
MSDPLDLPVADAAEIASFVAGLPLAVDRARLAEFLGGFPRRYFAQTPRVDIVKHFALMEGLRARAVISALARGAGLWRLEIMCRDRRFLFSRITGALSCHGLNILSAEAFANRSGLVLDTFRFADPDDALARDASRRDLQAFLERAVEGRVDLDALLAGLGPPPGASTPGLEVAFENEVHPSATLLRLTGPDFLGLLYLVSRAISEAGCDIELAHVRTPGQRAEDEFFLTRAGTKLEDAERRDLALRLSRLVARGAPPLTARSEGPAPL